MRQRSGTSRRGGWGAGSTTCPAEPSVTASVPGSSAPQPIASAPTSPAPMTTGVPTASPVSRAAPAVIDPIVASQVMIGGMIGGMIGRRSASAPTVLASVASHFRRPRSISSVADASFGSVAITPVRRWAIASFICRSAVEAASASGSCRPSHAIFASTAMALAPLPATRRRYPPCSASSASASRAARRSSQMIGSRTVPPSLSSRTRPLSWPDSPTASMGPGVAADTARQARAVADHPSAIDCSARSGPGRWVG